MEIIVKPIGVVRNTRTEVADDNWGGIISEIVVDDEFGPEALQGIEDFSHAEIIFHFHQVDENKIVSGARRPRDNPAWPIVGIFAQRGKNRPNRIGLTTVRILKRVDNVLFVTGLDAVDGTPVLDLKPVMQEFLPQESIQQPNWATELMTHYWDEERK